MARVGPQHHEKKILIRSTHNSQWVGLQILYDELSPKCNVAPIVSIPCETPAAVVSFLFPRASMISISPEDGQEPYSSFWGFSQIAVHIGHRETRKCGKSVQMPSVNPLLVVFIANTRLFKYDRDWFVCKQAALRSSCATLREWSHKLHPPSCSG